MRRAEWFGGWGWGVVFNWAFDCHFCTRPSQTGEVLLFLPVSPASAVTRNTRAELTDCFKTFQSQPLFQMWASGGDLEPGSHRRALRCERGVAVRAQAPR